MLSSGIQYPPKQANCKGLQRSPFLAISLIAADNGLIGA
jgi:hypothetical protein